MILLTYRFFSGGSGKMTPAAVAGGRVGSLLPEAQRTGGEYTGQTAGKQEKGIIRIRIK